MKKAIALVSILCLVMVLFISGCTEQSNTETNTGKTVTMTAEEVFNDMKMDSDWSTYIKILYNSLDDGDTLIIHDTIDNISYNPETNRTTITFNVSQDENMSNSLNFPFEWNLTGFYHVGDEVKITGTIKHVKFTYEQNGNSMDYELEIFKEMWTTPDEYMTSQGGALPPTSITKA